MIYFLGYNLTKKMFLHWRKPIIGEMNATKTKGSVQMAYSTSEVPTTRLRSQPTVSSMSLSQP